MNRSKHQIHRNKFYEDIISEDYPSYAYEFHFDEDIFKLYLKYTKINLLIARRSRDLTVTAHKSNC